MRSSLLLLALLPALTQAQAPPLTLESPDSGIEGLFGHAVAGVPDVNGDGRGDLLVGASGENGGAFRAGRAYLYSGATGAPLRTLESPNPGFDGRFGEVVSGVPDADGDGRGDLLVGAYQEDGGAFNAGRAYLFSGASGALLRTLISPNPAQSGFLGWAVSGVEDVDGDGRGDLLVGAVLEDIGGLEGAGRAYLYSGATGALLRTLTSPDPDFHGGFGGSVSGVPDADGDGRGDLLISEDYVVHLYSGTTGELLRTLTSPDPQTSGFFGGSVSGVPDADGDGRGDLLIGDNSGGDGEQRAGRAYLFSGATGQPLRSLTSPEPEHDGSFGGSVSGVPDADGDGRGDLLIGARKEDGGTQDAGRAYLFGGASGNLLQTLQSPNPEYRGSFGISVSGVADADGVGRGLLIGAYGELEFDGRAYLFRSDADDALTVMAAGEPEAIVPGGVVTVTARVTNNTADPVAGDLWVVATGGGPTLTRLIASGPLAPAADVTVTFDLRAPGASPPGTHTVAVNVGRFPDAVRASDAFDVTVVGAPLAGAQPAEPFVVEAVAADAFVADAPAAASRAPSSASVSVSPNPFAGRAALRFTLNEASAVRLTVHDVLGREVAALADRAFTAGPHEAVFDAGGLSAGVYVWRLAADGTVQTGRLTFRD